MFRKLLVITLSLLLGLYQCQRPQKPEQDRLKQLTTNLADGFRVSKVANEPLVGVWRADKASLQKTIGEKYLKNYQAKPDETSKAMLANRLKKIQSYLVVQPENLLHLITLNPNGNAGSNSGRWQKRSKLNYQGQLIGKTSKTAIRLRLKKGRLTYSDANGSLLFLPEKRSAEEIAQAIVAQIGASNELPGY